jgi:hypothetical protein
MESGHPGHLGDCRKKNVPERAKVWSGHFFFLALSTPLSISA